ncbi:MAG: cyclic peptide export ABC transporter [Planctomycetota bacterium]|jgi:putative ATP-binding cassette transporter|nr:cyclic peptide export ABC transporter [Planctomycetota bacterium]MDP6938409.1 cyclic peptide export ABC transporter [Planctomycetota bacterium]
MKLFTFLLKSNASHLRWAVLVSIISGVTSTGLIAMVHHIWEGAQFNSMPWAWTFLGMIIVTVGSGVIGQVMVLDLAFRALVDLRMELSGRILATPLRRIEEIGAPRLYATLTEDVNTLARVLPAIPRVIIDLTTLIAGVAYMAWLSWKAFIIVSIFATVGILVHKVILWRALGHMRAGREVFDRVFQSFRALHDGVKQLKLNRQRRTTFMRDEMKGGLERLRIVSLAGRKLLIGAESSTRLLFFIILGALIFVVPVITETESNPDALANLTGYIVMSVYLYRPMGTLMAVVPEMGNAIVALQKIEDIGLAPQSRAEPGKDSSDPLEWETLELVGGKFSFTRGEDDKEFTVGPVDLSFHPGEILFVIGGNGSGKTTLAKVLTSLYPLDEGELRLDGAVIDEENKERFRELFSVVFFDFHLFPDLMDAGGGDLDAQAGVYLRELQLAEKVKVEDGRLSTVELSQGQRRRLALLGAYLEDRPFYVFDEWAADQDPEFREVFYTKILPDLKGRGKTVFVITHDDRYLRYADRCLKLKDGQVCPETISRGEVSE